jgi:hypothetical protein
MFHWAARNGGEASGAIDAACDSVSVNQAGFELPSNIAFNKGDLIFMVAPAIFALYSVPTLKRPAIHGLSFLVFAFGCRAACLDPPGDLGIVGASRDETRSTERIDVVLRRGASLNACLSLLQPRGCADRCQPRRALLPRGAGVRLDHGDDRLGRAAAGLPRHRLRAGAQAYSSPRASKPLSSL